MITKEAINNREMVATIRRRLGSGNGQMCYMPYYLLQKHDDK